MLNLRASLEELKSAPLWQWKQLYDERLAELRAQKREVFKALDFLENATVKEFREKALELKEKIEKEAMERMEKELEKERER